MVLLKRVEPIASIESTDKWIKSVLLKIDGRLWLVVPSLSTAAKKGNEEGSGESVVSEVKGYNRVSNRKRRL